MTWEFSAPEPLVERSDSGRLVAAAIPLSRTFRGGNARLSAVDLSYSTNGPFPLELARFYDSFTIAWQSGMFGFSWHALPYQLDLSAPQSAIYIGAQ